MGRNLEAGGKEAHTAHQVEIVATRELTFCSRLPRYGEPGRRHQGGILLTHEHGRDPVSVTTQHAAAGLICRPSGERRRTSRPEHPDRGSRLACSLQDRLAGRLRWCLVPESLGHGKRDVHAETVPDPTIQHSGARPTRSQPTQLRLRLSRSRRPPRTARAWLLPYYLR